MFMLSSEQCSKESKVSHERMTHTSLHHHHHLFLCHHLRVFFQMEQSLI